MSESINDKFENMGTPNAYTITVYLQLLVQQLLPVMTFSDIYVV